MEPLVEIELINKKTGSEKYAFAKLNKKDIKSLFVDGKPNTKHKKYIGKSSEIKALTLQNRFTFKRAGLANPLSLEDYQNYGGLLGLKQALKLKPQDVVNEIKMSQIRGRGGAGFPAGVKWQTVLDAIGEQKFIIANADEGDSGTFADRLIMDSDPFSLIEGMIIAGKAVGASFGFIYLRSEYPYTYKIISQAIEIAKENNLLGCNVLGSDFSFDIELNEIHILFSFMN